MIPSICFRHRSIVLKNVLRYTYITVISTQTSTLTNIKTSRAKFASDVNDLNFVVNDFLLNPICQQSPKHNTFPYSLSNVKIIDLSSRWWVSKYGSVNLCSHKGLFLTLSLKKATDQLVTMFRTWTVLLWNPQTIKYALCRYIGHWPILTHKGEQA